MRTKIKQTSEFATDVIRLVKMIPRGKVATYSQIARLAGKPHAARGVAWILHACSKTHRLPWQRVLNAKGTISFDRRTANHHEQKKRLQAEGVVFLALDRIDLSKFQWKKQTRPKKRSPLEPRIFNDER